MWKVRVAKATAWLRLDWCVGRRLRASHLRRCRAATGITYVLLGFGSVITCIRLYSLMGARGMVASKFLELISLGIRYLGGILDMVVDELFISHVYQRPHVDARDGDEGKAPERDDLDEPVGKK